MDSVKTFLSELREGLGKKIQYLHRESIRSELLCTLCRDPAFRPLQHNACRRLYCSSCVRSVLQTSSTCLHCRTRMAFRGMLWEALQWTMGTDTTNEPTALDPPSPATELELGQLSVLCPGGCDRVLDRARLEQHLTEACAQACPRRCGCAVTVATVHVHDEVCTEKLVPCAAKTFKCSFVGPRRALQEHMNKCPVFAVQPSLEMLLGTIQKLERKVDSLSSKVIGLLSLAPR